MIYYLCFVASILGNTGSTCCLIKFLWLIVTQGTYFCKFAFSFSFHGMFSNSSSLWILIGWIVDIFLLPRSSYEWICSPVTSLSIQVSRGRNRHCPDICYGEQVKCFYPHIYRANLARVKLRIPLLKKQPRNVCYSISRVRIMNEGVLILYSQQDSRLGYALASGPFPKKTCSVNVTLILTSLMLIVLSVLRENLLIERSRSERCCITIESDFITVTIKKWNRKNEAEYPGKVRNVRDMKILWILLLGNVSYRYCY